ncbi:CmpA/NrtA family ABC transporter substrate-binding protein [Maridesulfovibrio sp. FT414]|uniref:CmpA/NrtA family ABC transporter substrate-binding protein n=1 Tax=Maridesulfovibrio sp. FT414 TaxID=2979469 RepID=UPI003D805A79
MRSIPNCFRGLCVLTVLLGLVLSAGIAQAKQSPPSLYMGYVFTTHHTPLMVAAIKGSEFKECGAYFEEMVPKQKYKLISKDGSTLAVINLIVSKSGSETSTLFAMNRLDLGLASSTAFMSGVDKGTKIKILCPMHVDGMSMVFPADSKINGWDDVAEAIKNSKTPLKLGYHSPTSAPRIVFEGALHKAGYKITDNPNNADADILMVDLKSTSNLIPALLGKQVDCWVGPAPHPVVAEYKHVGHIGLDSRDLPPAGHWTDFPCCVMGANEALISENPAVVQGMTDLMTAASEWSNSHKKDSAKIAAEWIGVPAEAVEKSTIIYTTNPTENWLNGEAQFLAMLNSMKKLKGQMKDVDIKTASPLLFDFTFVNNSLGK